VVSRRAFAKIIDNTLLKPTATRQEVIAFCERSLEYHFASVCVFPHWASLAAEVLADSDVKVCVPIGFPFGATSTAAKVFEAKTAIGNGAREIDVVINIGALRSGELAVVGRDLEEVVKAVKLAGVTENGEEAITKVILETCYLTDEEKIRAADLAKAANAEFLKTSTGFGPLGATVEDVRLLRRVVGKDMGVKAAGGIRTFAKAMEMVNAGATRIGTSNGPRILEEIPEQDEEEGQ